MQKSDPLAFCSDPGRFVDHPDSSRATSRHRSIEVIHRKTDVMDSRSAFGDEPGDGRVRGYGFQELDQRLAGNKADDARAVCVVKRCDRQAEYVAIKGQGIGQCRHGDT